MQIVTTMIAAVMLAWLAQPASASLHKNFTYRGKPVSPWCLYGSPTRHDNLINIDQCKPSSPLTIEDGMLSQLEPEEAVEPPKRIIRGRYSYRILDVTDDGYLLEYLWLGGGSGQFSGIDKARVIDNHRISLQPVLDVGDRCSFGIANVEHREGKIYAYRHVSLFDAIRLINGDASSGSSFAVSRREIRLRTTVTGTPVTLEEVKDSGDGPQSCYALARYEINSAKGQAQLVGIRISNTEFSYSPSDAKQNSDGQPYLECLLQSGILDDYYDGHLQLYREIPASDFTTVMRAFQSQCVK